MPDAYRSALYRVGSLKGILFRNRKHLTKRQLEEFVDRLIDIQVFLEGKRNLLPDYYHMKMISNEVLFKMKESCDEELIRRKRSSVIRMIKN